MYSRGYKMDSRWLRRVLVHRPGAENDPRVEEKRNASDDKRIDGRSGFGDGMDFCEKSANSHSPRNL